MFIMIIIWIMLQSGVHTFTQFTRVWVTLGKTLFPYEYLYSEIGSSEKEFVGCPFEILSNRMIGAFGGFIRLFLIICVLHSRMTPTLRHSLLNRVLETTCASMNSAAVRLVSRKNRTRPRSTSLMFCIITFIKSASKPHSLCQYGSTVT